MGFGLYWFDTFLCNLMAKNTFTKAAIVGVGGYIALEAWKALTVSNRLKVNVSLYGVKRQNITPVIILNVELINPSPASTTLESISGELNYRGYKVADIVYFQSIKIAAKKVTIIQVPVNISIGNTVAAFIFGQTKMKWAVDYNLNVLTPIGTTTDKGTFVLKA